MKAISFYTVLFVSFLLLPAYLLAQKKISIDVAAVSNRYNSMNGLNVSGFYHFSEHFTGGIEMNRFFPVNRKVSDEDVQRSAWDFDLNFHYLLPIVKDWKLYPLTGISHTSEKERNLKTGEPGFDRFWSFNTGAGILWEMGKWAPHIEYSFTWGHINQQFLIAGLSYEPEWGRYRNEAGEK